MQHQLVAAASRRAARSASRGLAGAAAPRQQGDDAAMARGGAASAAEAADPRTRAAEAAALAQRLDGVQLGRTPTTGPLLDRQGRPMRPFTIVSQRAVEQDRVFRPSHRLPTMSIEEYLDAEVARGGILPKQDDTPKVESDSDDEEVADRHTYKKRAWDAFTDDNKRGAGNRNWNRG
ncbi:TAP42-like family-domain-containing protein [Blastocladiella britannica]|nr:TAP42-like family-domain-containing protein [Blastocladiella britannica]